MKCVNHELSLVFNNNAIGISNYCIKCKRHFSKELIRRVIKELDI